MAITRFTVDVESAEEIPPADASRMGKELRTYMNGVIAPSAEDAAKFDYDETSVLHHPHVSNEDIMCQFCVDLARDEKS